MFVSWVAQRMWFNIHKYNLNADNKQHFKLWGLLEFSDTYEIFPWSNFDAKICWLNELVKIGMF
jgi:hypothetical protein